MKMQTILLALIAVAIIGTNGQITCRVKEQRSGEQRYCRFPFIIGRKRYDSCTDFKDPDGRKWCSTKTSNHTLTLHVHVGRMGHWGHCPDDCLEKEVGSCSDYAKEGFQCVHGDDCNEWCQVITDGGGAFTLRNEGLGCESDKKCSGFDEVCCKHVAAIKNSSILSDLS